MHLEYLKQQPWPLVDLIAPGPGFRIGESDFALTGHDGRRFTYASQALQLEAEVRLADHAVVISQRLRNTGSAPSGPIDQLEPLCLVFARQAEKWRHLFANGGTTENFYPPSAYRTHEWSQAGQRLVLESHPQGRSSNLHLPLLLSLSGTSGDSPGLFCGLEWSGAWYLHFEKLDAGQSCLAAGVKVRGMRLEPGEVVELPAVYLGFFAGGPEAGTNALRQYLYRQVCPAYMGKPVLPRVSYDHWFGIDNHLNAALMKRQAERAAELGVEVFVVDASWFPGNFPEGVGNWWEVDAGKFPNGLEEVADGARSLGMDFGLWFEPERAVEGTAFVREHLEWFVPVSTWNHKTHYHLNLARREAQDCLIELVGGWIERLDLRWSRWDYNIEPLPFWEKVDPTLKIQFEYFKGLYRVLDTLMREHPQWMVEGCASGGRRIDLGTLRRAHTFWFSDHTQNPHLCRYMQARANRFLPGHLLNSSVAVGLGSGDAGFDDAAILSRMLGKLAFDGDIASWSPQWTARAREWVEVFKAIRHLLVQDFYQLLPLPTTADDWDAVEFAARDQSEAVLFAFAGQGGGAQTLHLRGLDPDRAYALHPQPGGRARARRGAELMGRGMRVSLGPGEAGLWRLL